MFVVFLLLSRTFSHEYMCILLASALAHPPTSLDSDCDSNRVRHEPPT